MKPLYTILLLIGSNVFMTIAWYGHLKLHEYQWGKSLGLWGIILLSWGMAFFEYCLQVPANRMGSKITGGSFDLYQLKILQEVISLSVFTFVVVLFFKNEKLQWNYIAAFFCLLGAVYFTFKKV